MKRREFIALLGSAAVTWPLAARAQQSATPVIGFLSSRGRDDSAALVAAFHRGLKEAGFTEGDNATVEYRWAEGHYERLPALATDLVAHKVAVIAAVSPPAALAAKAATVTIPIIFAIGSDPVQLGLVSSLARPNGNLTGSTFLVTAVAAKRLQVLHELTPKITKIGILANPTSSSTAPELKELRTAAAALGLEIHISNAQKETELETALTSLVQQGVGALVVVPDPFFNSHAKQIISVAAQLRVPAIYGLRQYVAAGGLMMYGASLSDNYRQAGVYTGRILKGAKPDELPVMQSTKVDLIINQKTAKALGLTIPLSLLGRADDVVE